MTSMWIQFLFLFVFVFSSAVCEDENCKCVPSYLCTKDNGTIITDGHGIINDRLPVLCDCKCPGRTEVCCYLEKTITDTTTTSNVFVPIIDTSDRATDTGEPCGKANPDGIGYKQGTEENDAVFGEFPWMIGIFINENYRCGGSLIHPKVVLTAAHCVLKKVSYVARAGEWDSSNTKELFPHQDRKVTSIKIHQDYTPEVHYNDVALLILERPFELGKHIQVVCLPSNKIVSETEDCYATGWGKDKFGGDGQYPAILKKVLLPTLTHSKCEKYLRSTRLGQYFQLHKTFICAGGKPGQDTCVGDGGGPLMCPIPNEENRYQQVGITSWGLTCNEKDAPGVYANVAILKPWVDKQMLEEGLETTLYQF